MIISVSGMPGSGKSTVSKILCRKLKLKYYYIGKLRRLAAKRKGLTLDQFNKLGETDPSTDRIVDEYQKKLGATRDDFLIEGRTSFYFIPHSIKVFIDVSPEEGAKRIFKDLTNKKSKRLRNETRLNIKSVSDVKKIVKDRIKSDNLRYKKYYNILGYEKKNFDFVIDSTNIGPIEVANKIIGFIKKKGGFVNPKKVIEYPLLNHPKPKLL